MRLQNNFVQVKRLNLKMLEIDSGKLYDFEEGSLIPKMLKTRDMTN